MATNLVRFEAGNGPRWGVVTGAEIAPLSDDYPTIGTPSISANRRPRSTAR
jgi:Domain of unknown function (DUF2437)